MNGTHTQPLFGRFLLNTKMNDVVARASTESPHLVKADDTLRAALLYTYRLLDKCVPRANIVSLIFVKLPVVCAAYDAPMVRFGLARCGLRQFDHCAHKIYK